MAIITVPTWTDDQILAVASALADQTNNGSVTLLDDPLTDAQRNQATSWLNANHIAGNGNGNGVTDKIYQLIEIDASDETKDNMLTTPT